MSPNPTESGQFLQEKDEFLVSRLDRKELGDPADCKQSAAVGAKRVDLEKCRICQSVLSFKTILMGNDAIFMREALRLAEKAYKAEEVPVGAVVVRAEKIIARAYNQVELLKDASAHAEMLALTQAGMSREDA